MGSYGGPVRKLVLLFLLIAVPALGVNNLTGYSISVTRNYSSCAVSMIVNGDDDSTVTAILFQKWADTTADFDTGTVMVRRNHGGGASALASGEIFEGRIFWMTPGRLVKYRIEIKEGTQTIVTKEDTTSCTGVPQLDRTGTIIYLEQTTGNDSWDGLTSVNVGGPHGPVKTFFQALNRLAFAPDQGAHGGIVVGVGEYHEIMTLDPGIFPFFNNDGLPRFIIGRAPDRDSTILCGANSVVESVAGGKYNTNIACNWTLRPCQTRAASADSVWATPFPSSAGGGTTPGDSIASVILGWGEWLNKKLSFAEIGNDAGGEVSGWFWTAESLFVKRRSGTSPATSIIHIGYLNDCITGRLDNWHFANLTFRFGANGAFRLGTIINNSDIVIDSCRAYGFVGGSLGATVGFGNIHCTRLTVSNSIMDALNIGQFSYDACKGRVEEGANEVLMRCPSSSLVNNQISNGFNGLGMDTADQTDSLSGYKNEISGNILRGTNDDAIEMDTSHGINLAIFNNQLYNCGTVVSNCSTWTGPIWFIYNLAVDFVQGIKTGCSATGKMKAYHNTLTSIRLIPGLKLIGGFALTTPAVNLDGLDCINNIFACGGSKTFTQIQGPQSGGSTTTNSFNWNLYTDHGHSVVPFLWNNSSKSFLQIRSDLGWEMNGVSAAPAFLDSARFLYYLTPGSAAYRTGRRITGINTSLSGPRYVVAPSMGALSRICEIPRFPQ